MKLHFTRTVFVLVALALTPLASRAADSKPRPPLDGTWRWDFAMPDSGVAKPTLKVKTEEDGKLTGTARFRPGPSTPVKNLKLAGDQVSFDVERQRDGEKTVTQYRGTLRGDQITGKIISKWTGEEQTYPWTASRFSDLEGVWKWRPTFGTNAPGGQEPGQGGGRRAGGGGRGGGGGGGFGEASLTLKREEGDTISGKLTLGRTTQDITNAHYKDSVVTFQTERVRSNGDFSTNYYWGKFSGDTILGKYTTDLGGELRTNEWRAARND